MHIRNIGLEETIQFRHLWLQGSMFSPKGFTRKSTLAPLVYHSPKAALNAQGQT